MNIFDWVLLVGCLVTLWFMVRNFTIDGNGKLWVRKKVGAQKGDVMETYTDKELEGMDKGKFNVLFFKRFKKFLKHAKDPMQSLMCFGIETHRGWNAIIWRLTENIEKTKPKRYFEIVQIKEKFGGLRYYVEGGEEEIFGLIDAAERLSYKTCEECGDKGSLDQRFGWYLTLCRKCKIARGKKKKAEQEARFEQMVAERVKK